MNEEELKRQDLRSRNQLNIQVSQDGASASHSDMNPRVAIFCPRCSAKHSIEMSSLWKRDTSANRFMRWSCLTKMRSQKRVSLGTWLRFANDCDSDIAKWMKARDTYKDHQRPAHNSVKEYTEHTVYSRRGKNNLKRKKEHAETVIEAMKKPNLKQ